MLIPQIITYKEIMLLYGLSSPGAQRKLSIIRSTLGKNRHQHILLAEFAKAENVDATILENEFAKKFTGPGAKNIRNNP